ncbi:hypothetical protein [Sphingomonas xanthus]|uniref:Uncharacterized protein n=1 Tax=Sphingomonas xanthus TaxID=2594473 RepID=A0A516IQV2_9SPHN|nr:hypothetical protein [Sphingomonas xanthus]QDP19297.1 hypothetical protein FMM02_04550 [Sphingomonas xanthus]
MTLANIIMLALGLLAAAVGAMLLARRAATEGQAYARRIAGMMSLALGIFLAIFAVGLKGVGG